MKQAITALRTQIEFEKTMLARWKTGDLTLFPNEWTTERQKYFIAGMVQALGIIKEENKLSKI